MQRILNSTVHSCTGYAPAALIYGNSVTLDRELFDVPPPSTIVNLSQYMKELCAFQAHAIAASQSHLASLIDHRTLVSNQDVTQFKKFNIGDYVLVLNHSKSKLDFKWRGPYQIVRCNEANIYTCKDLRTNAELQFDVTALELFVCPPDVDPVSIACRFG